MVVVRVGVNADVFLILKKQKKKKDSKRNCERNKIWNETSKRKKEDDKEEEKLRKQQEYSQNSQARDSQMHSTAKSNDPHSSATSDQESGSFCCCFSHQGENKEKEEKYPDDEKNIMLDARSPEQTPNKPPGTDPMDDSNLDEDQVPESVATPAKKVDASQLVGVTIDGIPDQDINSPSKVVNDSKYEFGSPVKDPSGTQGLTISTENLKLSTSLDNLRTPTFRDDEKGGFQLNIPTENPPPTAVDDSNHTRETLGGD